MKQVELPFQTVVEGRVWELYSFSWESVDGNFSMYLYAINFEHAVALLEELKQTAKIDGIMITSNPAGS